MSYEEDLRRCQLIFRTGQVSGKTPVAVGNTIPACMEELHCLLESYRSDFPVVQENIYWVGILGAVGRLFEALMQNTAFKNILTWEFKNSVRRVLYHSRGPFCTTNLGEPIDAFQTVAFFTHCYEHCRAELTRATKVEFPSLAHNIDVEDRRLPLFHRVMNTGTIWAEQSIQKSEIKSKALARLESNEGMFIMTTMYIAQNLDRFLKAPSPEEQKKAIIIIGSYIGAQLAWLSCDVSSLLQERAIDEASVQDKSYLSPQELAKVRAYRDQYIDLGRRYRHENISLLELTKTYGFRLDSPISLTKAQDKKAVDALLFATTQRSYRMIPKKTQPKPKKKLVIERRDAPPATTLIEQSAKTKPGMH